jgi:dUTP pyrophosphatase
MSAHAAGADVCAAVERDTVIEPGARALIPAGFAIALPDGYEAQVRPRSGLALKNGVTCLNSPGTIDADYRGPVNVILANFGSEPFIVRRGDRIAQLVIAPVTRAAFAVVQDLSETERASNGFGSTGVA